MKTRFINISRRANTVSSQALPETPNRNYLLVQNNSAVTIYVTFTNKASVEMGLQILPTGNYEPFVIPSSSVHIVTSVGNADNIVIIEGVKE